MDFQELAKQRYSVRRYAPEAVGAVALNMVLEAALCAPTAHNLQPQRIFVLNRPELIEKIDRCTSCHFGEPCVLTVGYDDRVSWKREFDGKDHGEIDASIAATQIMLAAADLGLGTCWIGYYDPAKLAEEFPMDEHIHIMALIALGYPAETAHPAKLHEVSIPMEDMVQYL